MYYQKLIRSTFFPQAITQWFRRNTPIHKEDFLRQLDLHQETPENVRRMFRQIEFAEATIDDCGRISLDGAVYERAPQD